MAEDPTEGIDPQDVEELDQLYREILNQTGVHYALEITDTVGTNDSANVIVSPTSIRVSTTVSSPIVTVSMAEFLELAETTPLPKGIDRHRFKKLVSLTAKIAIPIGLNYVSDATHDRLTEVLRFVFLVLQNVQPYL